MRPDAEQFIAELGPAVAAAEAQERQGKIAAAKGAEALKLAQSFFDVGQLGDAAGVLDRLLREPGNGRDLLAEGYLLRGRVAAGQGDVLGAEVQFRRALELAPQAELAQPRGQETAAFEAARKTVAPGGLRLVQTPLGEAPAGVAGEHRRQGRRRQREAGRGAGARLPQRRHGRVPDHARQAAGDAVGPRRRR